MYEVKEYAKCGPINGMIKQHSLMMFIPPNGYVPLVYLQRPKWIADDEDWEKIVSRIVLSDGPSIQLEGSK